jgi:GYF domain 2
MQATYKILGGDGQEYGPATLEQMLGWVREGRVNATTQVWRSDQSAWLNAVQLPELQIPPQPIPLAHAGGVMMADMGHLDARLRSGASWFYWIAALSLINSVATLLGAGWRLIVGLGITQIVDAFAERLGGGGLSVALALNVLISGVFVVFGVLAYKRKLWAYAVGMGLYLLDGVIFAVASDWLAAAFHAFVLFRLFSGFRAAQQLSATT